MLLGGAVVFVVVVRKRGGCWSGSCRTYVKNEKSDKVLDTTETNKGIQAQIRKNMEKCAACDKAVYPLEMVKACNKSWHKLCFRCKECNMVLSLKAFAAINDDPYCKPHYMKLFHSKGNYDAFGGEGALARSGTGYTGMGFSGVGKVPGTITT